MSRGRFAAWLRAAAAALAVCTAGAMAAPAVCIPTAEAPSAAALQRLQAQARDRGFLWRIRKDGRESHLYGTVHVGRQEWLLPGPQLARAMAATQVLALELDPLDPAIQQRMAALVTRNAGDWPPALRPRMQAQADRVCLPAEAAALHPVLVLTTIELFALRAQGLHAEFAQEYLLSGWARGRGIPVTSLETPEAQMAALLGPAGAVDAEALEESLSALEKGGSAAVARTLSDTWANADLPHLADYAAWCACMDTAHDRAQVKALLADRNPALADGIDRLHGQGKPLLAAVGALHMIGPQGLPALLQARGYTVDYLPPAKASAKKAPAKNVKEP